MRFYGFLKPVRCLLKPIKRTVLRFLQDGALIALQTSLL
ncbi:hypothetical protein HMPREF9248_0718 [Fannyhessea vaginae PB189-T1-4]|uniref:Uncharacterized protein n=1 Tax=Fannyhessea vaginae PB189-T1-4 TaxID=866774 RepID=A0ABP2J301_9ACTN|nr:hypothetical protein HMPREF9248_0718 [Fannyhessea vaginae PB189-T1-4]